MTKKIAIAFLLLLNACASSAPAPLQIVPPPEVTQQAAPLPPMAASCIDDDQNVTLAWGILRVQNDMKAAWIAKIFAVKP